MICRSIYELYLKTFSCFRALSFHCNFCVGFLWTVSEICVKMWLLSRCRISTQPRPCHWNSRASQKGRLKIAQKWCSNMLEMSVFASNWNLCQPWENDRVTKKKRRKGRRNFWGGDLCHFWFEKTNENVAFKIPCQLISDPHGFLISIQGWQILTERNKNFMSFFAIPHLKAYELKTRTSRFLLK